MAYGLHHSGAEEGILVLDLGGGTFDVSILEVFEEVMEVRATAGDNRLSGDDFTGMLMAGFMETVGAAAGLPPLHQEGEARGDLRRAAEVAKRALTTGHEHAMTVMHAGQSLAWPVTREDFEARIQRNAVLSTEADTRLRKVHTLNWHPQASSNLQPN